MRRNFIQNYERNLVDPAVNSAIKYMIDKTVNEAVMTLIEVIKDNNEELAYSIENNPSIRDEILQKIGVDIGNRTFNCHDDKLLNRKTIR